MNSASQRTASQQAVQSAIEAANNQAWQKAQTWAQIATALAAIESATARADNDIVIAALQSALRDYYMPEMVIQAENSAFASVLANLVKMGIIPPHVQSETPEETGEQDGNE